MQLRKRVAALEAGAASGLVRIVWTEAGQTEAEAIAAYRPTRMGLGEKIMFVSWEGGCDATA